MGDEVRPGPRAGAAAPDAAAGRRVASRRGPGRDPRPGPLVVAGRRPARRRARRDPATPPRQARRAPPARQAPQEAGLAPTTDRDRQAALVRRREAGGRAQPRAPRPQGAQQPGREQPWPPQKTGAANAGLPLAWGPPAGAVANVVEIWGWRSLRALPNPERRLPPPWRPRHGRDYDDAGALATSRCGLERSDRGRGARPGPRLHRGDPGGGAGGRARAGPLRADRRGAARLASWPPRAAGDRDVWPGDRERAAGTARAGGWRHLGVALEGAAPLPAADEAGGGADRRRLSGGDQHPPGAAGFGGAV